MQKKEIGWICLLLVLGGVYVHFFGHWFDKKQIVIRASLRPSRRTKAEVWLVSFALNDAYKLTSLKVLPLQNGNPGPTAAWSLISDSNSVPTRAFRYGQHITGMKPALAGVHPEALVPDVMYRIILTAGNITGSNDFRTKNITP